MPIVNIDALQSKTIKLTGDVLAKIYLGKITKWNDARIEELNKNVKLPNATITIIHRSDGSGTTAIFSTYLSSVSKEWKDKVGSGKALSWPWWKRKSWRCKLC